MSKSLIVNESNLVAGSNGSQYKFKFNSSQAFNNNKIGLSKLSMYYSWYNIDSQLYNNHQFTYIWFNSSGSVASQQLVTIPDGYYTVDSLNLFLQSEMKKRGHYMKPLSGQNLPEIYYISIQTNPTYYACQLQIDPMPITIPTGYEKGGTWGLPPTVRTPQLVLSSSNLFRDLLGFNAGSYPPTILNTSYVKLSDKTPRMAPTNSLMIRIAQCSNGGLTNPNDIVYIFTQGISSYGDLIEEAPSNVDYIPISNGSYNELSISFVNQDGLPVKIKDTQLIMLFKII